MTLIVGFWGMRYQVKDVQRSISFYTQTLGFNLDMQNLPAFGQVSIGGLKLILSGPGASGSRPLPDGRQQEPGGPSTPGHHSKVGTSTVGCGCASRVAKSNLCAHRPVRLRVSHAHHSDEPTASDDVCRGAEPTRRS
jgi:catechol 2,3-dioxygenase-like lactoylglutathione lyase family enzyme